MTITMPRMNRLPAQERGLTIGDFLVPIRVSERLNTRARHLALAASSPEPTTLSALDTAADSAWARGASGALMPSLTPGMTTAA